MAERLPKKLRNEFPEEIQALSNGQPFLDVRSPSEYEKGSIPNSINLPILEDTERDEVGKEPEDSGAADRRLADPAQRYPNGRWQEGERPERKIR